jgi:hypothetical protein
MLATYIYDWLVVTTPLGLLFPIYGKIKNAPNQQPVFYYTT